MKGELESILGRGLKDGRTILEDLPNGHVGGYVITPEFDQLDFEARRKRIRTLLEKAVSEGKLDKSQLLQVSTLLAYTPEEWSVATSDLTSDN